MGNLCASLIALDLRDLYTLGDSLMAITTAERGDLQ
jgi:hypothetical protein